MTKQKKRRRTDDEKLQIVLSLRAIDDVFFEKLMEDPDVCQEILQVILENSKLRIKKETLVAQKSVRNLAGRSVRLDAYTEGSSEEVFNIEIQRSDNCNHVKRVRFNASCITANNSEPGDEFENVQELYVIYISEFDIFGDGLTVYHAETTVKETKKAVNDGLHEVYVNTACNDGSKIARLMEKFLQTEVDDAEFPCMSKRVKYLKHDKKEVERMCQKIEDYAKKQSVITAIEIWTEENVAKENILKKVIKKFNISKEFAEECYEETMTLNV